MENNEKIAKYFKFLKVCEKLKTELRHSWTSDPKRQESVAEHTWMMSLLTYIFLDEVELKLDKLKIFKMIIIHDIVEAVTGDIPVFKKERELANAQKNELRAIEEIIKLLPDDKLAQEIQSLFIEFEECKTNEARYAKAIDKIEVLLQHNMSDIKSWSQGDYDYALYVKDYLWDIDPFLRKLKDKTDIWTFQKAKNEGGDILRFKKSDLEEWKKRNLDIPLS